MALREEVLARTQPGVFEEPDGDFLELVNVKDDRLVVLTRDDTIEASSVDDAAADEQDDYPTNDEGEPLCVGKEDGQCGNTVDEPGGTCWHHED